MGSTLEETILDYSFFISLGSLHLIILSELVVLIFASRSHIPGLSIYTSSTTVIYSRSFLFSASLMGLKFLIALITSIILVGSLYFLSSHSHISSGL